MVSAIRNVFLLLVVYSFVYCQTYAHSRRQFTVHWCWEFSGGLGKHWLLAKCIVPTLVYESVGCSGVISVELELSLAW